MITNQMDQNGENSLKFIILDVLNYEIRLELKVIQYVVLVDLHQQKIVSVINQGGCECFFEALWDDLTCLVMKEANLLIDENSFDQQ